MKNSCVTEKDRFKNIGVTNKIQKLKNNTTRFKIKKMKIKKKSMMITENFEIFKMPQLNKSEENS